MELSFFRLILDLLLEMHSNVKWIGLALVLHFARTCGWNGICLRKRCFFQFLLYYCNGNPLEAFSVVNVSCFFLVCVSRRSTLLSSKQRTLQPVAANNVVQFRSAK